MVSSLPLLSPLAAMLTTTGGNTAARRIAADSEPPSRMAEAIVSTAARNTLLLMVRAVSTNPSITGKPLAIMVESVRAIRRVEIAIRRPITGKRSNAPSNFKRSDGLRSARAGPADRAKASRISHPHCVIRFERTMTIRVSVGSVWPIDAN
jgi:hypothetical protein